MSGESAAQKKALSGLRLIQEAILELPLTEPLRDCGMQTSQDYSTSVLTSVGDRKTI